MIAPPFFAVLPVNSASVTVSATWVRIAPPSAIPGSPFCRVTPQMLLPSEPELNSKIRSVKLPSIVVEVAPTPTM